jgi:hypothetical protein
LVAVNVRVYVPVMVYVCESVRDVEELALPSPKFQLNVFALVDIFVKLAVPKFTVLLTLAIG